MLIRTLLFFTLGGLMTVAVASMADVAAAQSTFPSDENVSQTVVLQTIIDNSQKLTPNRRGLLDAAADKIRRASQEGPVNLLGVCTHNSRRSQFCEAWCGLAIAYYRVPNIDCFSCGTEATACNPRTVDALERHGWQIKRPKSIAGNPQYECAFGDAKSVRLWSKAFGDPTLPTNRVVALLCCDEADKACPTVPGSIARVALHYVDPKVSDGTAKEAATYDERCQQIAAEMFYLIRQLSPSRT